MVKSSEIVNCLLDTSDFQKSEKNNEKEMKLNEKKENKLASKR